MNTTSQETELGNATTPQPEWLKIVHHKVDGLRFGVLHIVVHDGKVTQLERTEKIRLP